MKRINFTKIPLLSHVISVVSVSKKEDINPASLKDVHIIRTLEKGADNVERVTSQGGTDVSQATAVGTVSMTEPTATGPGQLAQGLHAVQQPDRAANASVFMDAQRTFRELVELVKTTRDMVKNQHLPTAKTQADYRKKANSISQAIRSLDELVPSEGNADRSEQLLCLALGKYAGKSRSFFAMRAAASFALQQQLRTLLKRQDQFQKELRNTKNSSADTSLAELRQLIAQLQYTRDNYLRVQGLDREKCLKSFALAQAQHTAHLFFQKHEATANTKELVHLLDKYDPEWKQRFREMQQYTKSRYRAHALLQSFCGIRPEEFSLEASDGSEHRGVKVELVGAVQLVVSVRGAKVKDKAGQKLRTFEIDMASGEIPEWFLQSIQASGGVLYLEAKPDALAKHYQRISAKMFSDKRYGRLKTRLHITPYAFRHALAADLRNEEWNDVEIAEILGQQSAETSLWYGKRRTGKKKPSSKNHSLIRGSAQVSVPVRTQPNERSHLYKKEKFRQGSSHR